ncbi:hypothetical protein OH492_19430 [Vibrio chagasii]|nr:hypothetical protein [Vibrio chagasii]
MLTIHVCFELCCSYSEYSELFEYVLVDELEDAQEAQVEFSTMRLAVGSESRT